MSTTGLPAAWRERADLFRKHAGEPQAKAYEIAAAELEAALQAEQFEALTLEAAAIESGYTRGHLRREIREAKIPNAGTEAEPLILRTHLPRKPGYAVAATPLHDALSRSQVARAVVDEG